MAIIDPTPTALSGDFQVNSYTTAYQFQPAVAALANGGAVLAWTSTGEDVSGYGVYARIRSAAGTLGTPFRVNVQTTTDQFDPSITALSDGRFIVSWTSFQNGHADVWSRIFNSDGSAATSEFRVNQTEINNVQEFGSWAELGGGKLVAIWQSDDTNVNDFEVQGRIFTYTSVDATTATVTRDGASDFTVNTTTNLNQFDASVATLQDGGFVVTWSSFGQDGSSHGIYAQRFDSAGAKVNINGTTPGAQEVLINSGATTGDQRYSTVTTLSNGNILFTWSSNPSGSNWDVFGRIYSPTGTAGSIFAINSTTNAQEMYSSATALPNGEFFVSWGRGTSTFVNSDSDVYGQRFSSLGAKLGSEIRLNQIIAGGQYQDSFDARTQLATLNDGSVIATWAGTTSEEVFARTFDVPADYIPLLSGDYWSGIERIGTPVFVTYSFPTVSAPANSVVMGSAAATFQAFNSTQQAAARAAIDQWANASGLVAIEVAPGTGDINFGLYDFGAASPGGIALYPFGDWNGLTIQPGGTTATYFSDVGDSITTASGDVFINSASLAGGVIPAGLLLHEIGHALGLKHVATQTSGGDPIGDAITYSGLASHEEIFAVNSPLNNTAYTVMSYEGASPTTLGSLDVAAIRAIYGTNAQDGTQVASYSFNSGTQTLTQTGHASASNIMLGVSIADIMTGGNLDDQLYGYAGNDSLLGGAGNDQLWGGRGNDTMDGGAGFDVIHTTLFDATAADADVVQNFAFGEDVIDVRLFSGVSWMGPASFGVLVDHLLRTNGAGFASLNAFWNGRDQTLAIAGVTAGQLSATDFIFDISGAARNLTGSTGADMMFGGLGADTLNGGDGGDRIAGDAGADSINGGAGNDRLDGGADGDIIDGGTGTDRLVYAGAVKLILDANGIAQASSAGDAAGDQISNIEEVTGSEASDIINVSTVIGQIFGMGGDDTLTGGVGTNFINGGLGNDVIRGGGANGTAMVGNQAGTYTVESLRGDDGDDTIFTETLAGQSLNAHGDGGKDTIHGGAGNEWIEGNDGDDLINGGGGLDRLLGGAGADTIFTESLTGQSVMAQGDAGNDLLTGSAGTDLLEGGADNDTLLGGESTDLLWGDAGADFVDGGLGSDIFYDTDGMSGDTYIGGSGADQLYYTVGTSFDFSAPGADIINAAEMEVVMYMNASTVTGSSASDTFYGNTSVANADTFNGMDGVDNLFGYAGNDILSGGNGNDRLEGGQGADFLRGGAGVDRLTGGDVATTTGDGASDTFAFAMTEIDQPDHIYDFEAGLDLIQIDNSGIAPAAIASRFFNSFGAVTGASAALIYDAGQGRLFFDADGTGAGQAKLVTVVDAAGGGFANVTAADLLITT